MSHLSLVVSSYNVNLMLASIISLLLLILFLLLLHVYAKWLLLLRARRPGITRRATSLSGFLGGFHPSFFSGFDSRPTKGLNPSLIESIPIFLYKRDLARFLHDDDSGGGIMRDFGLECVICLSHFEEDEVGRALDKCGHAFHMECIDMWLHSHTTCPICRAPAVSVPDVLQETNNGVAASGESERDELRGVTRDWEAVIQVLEGNNDSRTVSGEEEEEEEEGEVVSVVMDVFIVSVSVSRGGSSRQLTTTEEGG